MQSWFLREDSRFFATAPLSLYDVFTLFTSPQNSLGQYRPITKLLWILPRSVGLFEPVYYHCITAFFLIGSAAFFYFFLRLCQTNMILAAGAAISYSLLAVHNKPMFWISAWQNTVFAFFAIGALYFRVCWRNYQRQYLRILSMVFYFLAITSRETGVLLFLAFTALDLKELRLVPALKKNADAIFLFLIFFTSLYLFNAPLHKVNGSIADILPGAHNITSFWQYLTHLFYPVINGKDHFEAFVSFQIFAGITVLLMALSFRHKHNLAITFFILSCIGLHIVFTKIWNIEYAAAMSIGVLALWFLTFSQIINRFIPQKNTLASLVFSLLMIGWIYAPAKIFQAREKSIYLNEGKELRLFVERLSLYEKNLPKNRILLIRSFEWNHPSDVGNSHHWIELGLEEFVKNRFVLFDTSTLSLIQGIGRHSIDYKWLGLDKANEPIEIRYKKETFSRD